MADLVGIAAIVAVIGSPLTVLFTQYNTRKALKDALLEKEEEKKAAKKDADDHLKILNEQTGTLARIEGNTDGALSKITDVAKNLGIQKDAALMEVERLQPGATTPTPEGRPTATQQVGIVEGHAKAYDPSKKAPQ